MCIVYGRKGKDAFTCVSNKGSSVVDYCVVGVEYVHIVCNFRVTTMSESIEEMKLTGEASILFADHATSVIPQRCNRKWTTLIRCSRRMGSQKIW